jgi:hypothetical protein
MIIPVDCDKKPFRKLPALLRFIETELEGRDRAVAQYMVAQVIGRLFDDAMSKEEKTENIGEEKAKKTAKNLTEEISKLFPQ